MKPTTEPIVYQVSEPTFVDAMPAVADVISGAVPAPITFHEEPLVPMIPGSKIRVKRLYIDWALATPAYQRIASYLQFRWHGNHLQRVFRIHEPNDEWSGGFGYDIGVLRAIVRIMGDQSGIIVVVNLIGKYPLERVVKYLVALNADGTRGAYYRVSGYAV